MMQKVNLYFQKKNGFYIQEAFKTLRSNIEFCGDDIKVIAVTSCLAHEGKSSVAMELAKSFAEAGNRTLFIDADMRKSVLIGRYKTGAVKYGLSHCLTGKSRFMDAICETNIPRMYVLFSGPVPPNPSELLGSKKFSEMLSAMRKPFAYIVIDTPPLGSVIDAAVTARSCDGTALVIENNAISYRFAQKVKDQLDKTGSRILGVVLNKVDMSGRGYYGHYGKYYGKYYGDYYGGYESDQESIETRKKKLRLGPEKELQESQRWEGQGKKEKGRRGQIEKLGERRFPGKAAKRIFTAVAAVLLICGLSLSGFEAAKAMGKRSLQSASDSRQPELPKAIGINMLNEEEQAVWQDGWIKYQDTIYQYNQDILTFLVMGIDRDSDATEVEEGTAGGQADALFLAVMNPNDGSIKVIGINRNTMTDIDIYNDEGAYIATTQAQIAVQHGFGNGVEKSCEYQKKAVEKLFYNLPIHGYAAINMNAIPTINDAVGGVDVTVLEDLTKMDKSLVKGSNVHLSGDSAFWYVKYRDTDIFASADMRLERQKQYLTSLIKTAQQEVKGNISVALDLYKAISPQMVTDISIDEAAYLVSSFSDYQFEGNGFYLMEGETVKGEEFEEFYPDEDALYEMILDVFYEKVE